MRDFIWACPTQYVFGKGAEQKVGAIVKGHGVMRALIVYGGGSAVKSGLVGRVEASLDEAGIAHEVLGGVRPNPEVAKVREGVQQVSDAGADGVIAVGGGSVIDCAKAIAFSAGYEGDPWDFFSGKAKIGACLPVFGVLTIPAAGSESSNSCVISNDVLGEKRGVNSEAFRPKAAFMNPEVTFTLPAYQTAAGATDMIAHICERWFSGAEAVPVTDRTAAGLIKTIMEAAPVCLREPENYDARANLMWAGTLAHNGIAGVGRNLVPESRAGGWESHAIEHELSALKPGITHGAGLAVILPAWMRYVWREDPERFLDFGREVFGIEPIDESFPAAEGAVAEAIGRLAAFFHSIGMPKNLRELGIAEEDIPVLVDALADTKGEEFGAFMKLSRKDTEAIYRSAL